MRSLARLWELEEQLLEPREEQLWSPSGLEEQLVDPQLGQEHLGDILLGPKFKCPGMTRAGTSRKTTNNSKFIIV